MTEVTGQVCRHVKVAKGTGLRTRYLADIGDMAELAVAVLGPANGIRTHQLIIVVMAGCIGDIAMAVGADLRTRTKFGMERSAT